MKQLTEEQRKMVEDNYGLAIYYAKKHWNGINPSVLDEYISDARFALVEAAMTYDPAKGFFRNRLFWLSLRNMNRTTRQIRGRSKLRKSFSLESALDSGADELDRNLQQEPNTAIDEFVPLVHKAIQRLSPRNRQIVIDYFYEGMTMKQIGDKIGRTRERVRQILEESKSQLAVSLRRLLKK